MSDGTSQLRVVVQLKGVAGGEPLHNLTLNPQIHFHCDFCKKSNHDVEHMLCKGEVNICSECIEICHHTLTLCRAAVSIIKITQPAPGG